MNYRGVVLDMDGTVYRGRELLPGARETIEAVRAAGLPLLFLSNNPTETRQAYVERLARFEIEATEEEVLSAGTVTTDYLRAEHAGEEVFTIGASGLREQFAAAGLSLTDDPGDADVLVASWTDEFDYGTMTEALRALEDGDTAFLGSDPDRTVPAGEGRTIPGSGAIIGAVAAVAGRDPDRVLGKPSPEAAAAAEEALGVPLSQCLLVGDRLDTDIAFGERAEMTTALVLTGASTRADVEGSDYSPDHVFDSLEAVPSLIG